MAGIWNIIYKKGCIEQQVVEKGERLAVKLKTEGRLRGLMTNVACIGLSGLK